MTGHRVIAVAHFPPPVHGMAVAVERLVSELEGLTSVRRVNIAAPGLDRSPTYHLVRVARVARAIVILGRERRRSSRVFFSCDAGVGMAYTFVLTVWARLCGYRIHLQHHSYAYVDQRSPLLALLVRLVRGCVHIVICPGMRADFLAAYPEALTRVAGVAGGLVVDAGPRRTRGPRFVLGFLGNVCLDKGVDLAVDVARAAGRSGLPVELRVAGPVVDRAAAALLEAVESERDVELVQVGPVYADDRDRFLDELDVLLFPSRYAHESFGLVVWEAMARGVPVLAHRSGCTTAEALGGAGVAIDRSDDFVRPAADVLGRWWRDPQAHRAAGDEARSRARSIAVESRQEISGICAELAETAAVGPMPAGGGT